MNGLVVVVAAAFLREDPSRVLASRRTGPPALAGRWEFPGGKVEPGETEVAALHRELQEELGVQAVVGERLGGDLPIGDGAVLRVYLARLVAGEPHLLDHDEHRWLTAGQLDSIPWLPVDLPLVDELRRLMSHDNLERNKANVKAFYDLMFNQDLPADAIERYAGADYRQHNPHVGDGK